jgi:riboflavin kinase / FMN adenylyltransferase
MIHIHGLDKYQQDTKHTICLGTFDGFHKGHQILLSHCDYMVSLHPHPKEILNPTRPIEYLTFPNELSCFVKNLVQIPFSKSMANMSWNTFLDRIIVQHLAPKKIIVGYDFKFGKHQQGSIQTLKEWGQTHPCEIIEIPKQCHTDNTPYKSSIIRDKLKTDPNLALELLGHPYPISGTVIQGDQRGKDLGFPTANIQPPKNKCIPKHGVYCSTTLVNKTPHPSITYIGNKPTFSTTHPSIETHILNNFSDTLYDEEITVMLTHFMRKDHPFDSKEALIDQIKKDIQIASNYRD